MLTLPFPPTPGGNKNLQSSVLLPRHPAGFGLSEFHRHQMLNASSSITPIPITSTASATGS